jgi:inhibitor of KinA
VHIPVLYGSQFGPDLPCIAERSKLSQSEVIDIHTSVDYPVYMLGFAPGFCYLGGVDQRIAVPRLESPRTSVIAGSVGIAGSQTGIYPLTGPGGWQILGRTPVRIFNPHRIPYFLIKAGDFVRFYAIDETTFSTMQHEAESKSPADAKKSSK